MYNTSFIKKILLAATVVLLYSCDKDFNAIGDDLIGDNHFDLAPEKYDVLAYNQEVTPIQSNALLVNGLGIYDNPVFGTTTANYVTQVALGTYAPTIGESPVIETVTLSIPYFSHTTGSVNTEGLTPYALDSIYGAKNGRIKLSVYESGVQMRGSFYDNGTQFPQYYYTDMDSNTDPNYINFDAKKVGVRLNNYSDKTQNDEFYFDAKQQNDTVVDDAGKETINKVKPGMRLYLNKAYFQKKILEAPADKLAKPDTFQEYFRGLYFKAERADGYPSNMALLNFAEAVITIKYKAKTESTADDAATTEEKSLTISFGGATAGLLKDNKATAYADAIKTANVNKTTGDPRLYLKGGQGSLAVIDLKDFGSKLDDIRAKNWMVNEANLVFTIDSDKMGVKDAAGLQANEPKRVYLYDLTNNVPILDYTSDRSTSITSDARMSKIIYGGIISVDATTKRGTTYKIRLTEHIRNLIKTKTATNVKLGLAVMDDITITTSNKLKNKNDVISEAPRASVVNPLGTILFGNNIPSTDASFEKRLRLEVYYTKPN
ncbi:uncharacterized protein DUF4270 [Flavobacterium cutihirudinis]|uniref:Uncharacterized protein DUF4270 n=1 Tax=Flavobacterium cutihirudinis TaxID=1265740 RepID=A0A3D9FVG3_9FLAO|nr:DUF4270 domain-containing protein [Flavobacterium cutihirudinis]RED24759.1 uncharacterized protein DUF4270 [Flavobacterium cutihirudinis]